MGHTNTHGARKQRKRGTHAYTDKEDMKVIPQRQRKRELEAYATQTYTHARSPCINTCVSMCVHGHVHTEGGGENT